MEVFITRKVEDSVVDFLKSKKIKVSYRNSESPISRKELLNEVKDKQGVIAFLTDKFDKELINEMNGCKIIANYAVGFNNIDVNYAKEKGIIVTNTPDVLTESTADLTMALILACARRIVESDNFLRAGKFKGWKPGLLLGIELKDKILGIIGAGRIGTATASRAKAFGMKIIYHSNNENDFLEKNLSAKKENLKTLLKNSDIISLHLPLNKKTYHIIGKDEFILMKPSAIIVNTSRGEIINEKELITVLKKKKIFAAGLDVFENEPNINTELIKLKNAVLLPHIGSATYQARNDMIFLAAKNVAAVLNGRKPLTPVN